MSHIPKHKINCDEYHAHTHLGLSFSAERRCCISSCPGCKFERMILDSLYNSESIHVWITSEVNFRDGNKRITVETKPTEFPDQEPVRAILILIPN